MGHRGVVVALLTILVLGGTVAIVAFAVPAVPCSDCRPLYDAILGPGQPPEDWRVDCGECAGRRRLTLAQRKFGNHRGLGNPWLVCLLRGDGKVLLPKRGEPMWPEALQAVRPALPVLTRALRAKDVGVAYRAGFFLGQIGDPAAEAVPHLIAAARDSSLAERGSAVWALGGFKAQAALVVPVLVSLLKGSDVAEGGVLCDAVDALGDLGPVAKDAVPSLLVLLREGDPSLRSAVAQTLGKIGPDAAAAIPDLTRLAGDPDPKVSKNAAWALKEVSR